MTSGVTPKDAFRADHTEKRRSKSVASKTIVFLWWSSPAGRSSLAASSRFWGPMKVKIISALQLKVWSHTARQCHFWPKQPIKSGRRRALVLTTSFLFYCQGNSGENSRIMANTDKRLLLAVSVQMHFQGVSGVVVPGCFSV